MATYSGTGIFTYNKDSLKTYRHTLCDDDGRKYYMDWVNNDTVIYINLTYPQIFGLDVSKKIVGVKEPGIMKQNEEIEINIFPNPFNNSVQIDIKGKIESPEIIIYNINGDQIKDFRNLIENNGKISVFWDGKNNRGQNVSSGMYFLSLIDNKAQSSHLIVQKIINLK